MNVRKLPQGIGEPVFLRALEDTDIEATFRWHNDSQLYENLGDPFRFVAKISEANWIRTRSTFSDQEINLAICLTRTRIHIGNCYVRNIDWVARTAALHVFIGDRKQRGKGYGASAVEQVLRHAFCDIGLNRIWLEVLKDNVPAIKLYKKCGFVQEGCLRGHRFKNGRLKDVLLMGIMASEFMSQSKRPA